MRSRISITVLVEDKGEYSGPALHAGSELLNKLRNYVTAQNSDYVTVEVTETSLDEGEGWVAA